MPDTKKREYLTTKEFLKEQDEHCERGQKEPLYWLIAIVVTFSLGIFALVLSTYAKREAALPRTAESLAGPAHAGLTFQAFAAKAFVPYLVVVVLLLVGAVAYAIILSQRCPQCRRYFSRGKLNLYTTNEHTVTSTDSAGNVSEHQETTSVYWTECKHCGKVILVYR
jgi:hypothetical protein